MVLILGALCAPLVRAGSGKSRGMTEPTPAAPPLLLAEDLLLLLLDDDVGTLRQTNLQPLLGGAVLAELALLGAVEVEEKQAFWQTARVRPVPGERPADPVLADAHDVVAEKPRTAQDLATRLGKPLKARLTDRLVARGVLRREDHRVLGLFPSARWPAEDSRHEDEVRRRLADVLLRGFSPDPRTVALVALLSAVDQVHKVVPGEGLGGREVRKRAKQLVADMDEGEWVAKAVRDAVRAATTAVTAGVVAGSSGDGSS